MKFLFKIWFGFLLFVSNNVLAQLPYNLGFETGTFDGWECISGIRGDQTNFIMDAPGPPNIRHNIIGPSAKDQLDPYGNFPVLCPNGSNYSIKLGSIDTPRFVERISRTLANIPANFTLVFNYAIVLDANAAHGPDEQPLFRVQIFDAKTGDALPCPSFNFVATLGIPGFTTSEVPSIKIGGNGNNRTYPVFRNWTTGLINLKDYAGKDVRIEFTTADCDGNIHFAYAYIDIDEKLSLKPITGATFCKGQDSTTLIAPDGFADYVWYKDNDLSKPGVTGKSIRILAVDKAKYALKLIPYPDFGCEDILYTELEELTDDFKLVVKSKIYGCAGGTVNITTSNITAGSTPMKYSYYYENELGIVYLPNPNAISKPGIYYVRGTNAGGCTDIQPIEVVFENLVISVTDPRAVRYPTKVDLSATFTHLAGVSYDYFTDAAATKPMIDFSVNVSGTYYIKATSSIPCSVIAPVKVIVNPPPPYTIEAPNTFTPNNDGINDNFYIKTTGYVTLTQLTIYNRYGQPVYTTRSLNNYWTGNSGSATLPTGTYYWVFEGTDDYFHTKVRQASSITIVR